ncbi:MAG TPA: hypothetical protein VGY55_25130 [Pirellulales bacterium]|jgi:hypothetical protein|nr:hypothetical protein [Pirellulales bacterium]
MAAKENQGLQIALIGFVMLTILLSVTTYLFFKNWQEADGKMKAAQTDASKANDSKTAADKDVADLKTIIGSAPTDDVGKIKTDVSSSINGQYVALGLTALPADQQNLLKVNTELGTTIKAKYADVESRDTDIKNLKKQLAADAEKATAKLNEAVAARDAAVADLDKERAAYKAAVDELKTGKEQLVQDKNDLNKKLDELKAGDDRRTAELRSQLDKTNKDLAAIKDAYNKYFHLDPSATGGQITWVNQRDEMAYINLGWDDGLHRRITFSAYPPGTTDVEKGVAKGKIEVINVTGPHQAEARIVENPVNNPLLPGDMIHTQGWHPGQHEHFAIAGFIDIDGVGRDQTKKLHDLILANGGIVDVELVEEKSAEGKTIFKSKGEMTVNTRYLIMGEQSADKAVVSERLSASGGLSKEAARLGVEQIGLQKFLGMMGYTPHSAAGIGSSAPDADTNGFRPRTPPARGKDDGAF